MIILLAESKTMNTSLREISPELIPKCLPIGEPQADEIMWGLREATEQEIMNLLKVSANMAREIRKMIYSFPDKLQGLPAIEAFTGVVFRYLRASDWSDREIKFASSHLRIVSSLYGLLRPEDIIRPYRLDYTAKAAPGDLSLQNFWKKQCTIDLVKHIQATGQTEILNLLPTDASRCFDWKLIKRFARVYIVQFKELTDSQTMKTPVANRLKELRGKMTREIISNRYEKVDNIKTIEHDDFIYKGDLRYPDYLTFFC